MEIKLNVYNEDMVTIKKTVKANTVVIPFGLVRKLMALFNMDNLKDTAQIIGIVMKSWDSVVVVLDRVFPDIEPDEWDFVSTTELATAIVALLKDAFAKMLNIPAEKN